jgi:Holliday junction DNA helicase RuvA
MIGRIKGTLTGVDGNIGLIETSGGVSYQLFLTPSIIGSQRAGQTIAPYTYLQVREDALVLFGFETKHELEFFRMLLTVPGVGPKTAFSVISYAKIDEIVQSVKDNDVSYFSRIPGLGKKTSMKIMLELSQRLKEEFKFENTYLSESDKTVIDALVSLGFKSVDARHILSKIPKDYTIEERIREGIKLASGSK